MLMFRALLQKALNSLLAKGAAPPLKWNLFCRRGWRVMRCKIPVSLKWRDLLFYEGQCAEAFSTARSALFRSFPLVFLQFKRLVFNGGPEAQRSKANFPLLCSVVIGRVACRAETTAFFNCSFVRAKPHQKPIGPNVRTKEVGNVRRLKLGFCATQRHCKSFGASLGYIVDRTF